MAGVISAGTVFAGIGAASSLAGVGLKAGGQMKGGQAQADSQSGMYKYQAQVARNNAVVQRQMADRTVAGGLVNADVTGLRGAAKVAGIKAKQGASGINVNKGSAVDVRAGAATANQFDAETVLRNADLTAYGYRVKADQEEAQAGLYDMAASGAGGAATAGKLAGAGTLLEGASSLPWKWAGGLLDGKDSGIDKEIADWSTYGSIGSGAAP